MIVQRTAAATLSLVSTFIFVLLIAAPTPALAASPVFGTVQVNGPVWISSDAGKWDPISSTRPLVAGDRLKTGEEGYLLADLGAHGIVGMYGNTEISAGEASKGALIGVLRGKLAFHLSAYSDLTIQAADAQINSNIVKAGDAADGYVEVNEFGDAVVAVEDGTLSVNVAGTDRRLAKGERMLLNKGALGGRVDGDVKVAAATRTETIAPAAQAKTEPPAERIAAADQRHDRDRAAGLSDSGSGNRKLMDVNGTEAAGAALGGLAVIGGFVAINNSGSDNNGSPGD